MRVAELTNLAPTLAGTGACSVWVGPVRGKAWFTAKPDTPHYAASTMKLALVMAAFREADDDRIDLDSMVPVHNTFTSEVAATPEVGGGGYGVTEADDSDPRVWRRLGTDVTLRWLAYRAIVRSSNLATNLLIEAVGLKPVEALLDVLGCHDSTVARAIEDAAARQAGLDNLVTARDLARQFQALGAGSVLSPASSLEILDVLAAQQINDALPRGLPAGTKVAHKSGWVEGVSHDAGLVYPTDGEPFVFVMCTTTDLDARAGTDLIARTAAAAWTDIARQP